MAKMKLDTQKLKQLLLQKAELVALVGAGFLAVLFLILGLVLAFSAGSPDQAINKDAQSFKQAMDTARPEDEKTPEGEKAVAASSVPPEWTRIPKDTFLTGVSWYDAAASTELKKRNPLVRGIEVVSRDNKELYGQMTGYVGPVIRYDVRRDTIQVLVKPEEAATKALAEPVHYVRFERLAIGEFYFPYREEVKDYLKALRIDTPENLLAKGLAPVIDGFDVVRGDIHADGKVDWTPVYSHKDDKVELSKDVRKLLTEAAYDDSRFNRYPSLPIIEGAASPFPKLPAPHAYPELKLEGLAGNKAPDDPDGNPGATPNVPTPGIPTPGAVGPNGRPGMPNQPGAPEKTEGTINAARLKVFPKPFQDRVSGLRLNPFSPYGIFTDTAKDDGKLEGGRPNPFYTGGINRGPYRGVQGAMPMPPGRGAEDPSKSGTGVGTDSLPEKVLIRFVDAGLQPGHTYQYSVRVRLKNPNFGKPKEVAYPSLAEKKILESPWVLTPPVTIPPDSFFYVVDQQSLATKLKGSKTIDYAKAIRPGTIPVQIHQIVEVAASEGLNRKIADWVIAERLFIGRGELIARPNVEVEVPVWDEKRNSFVLGDRVTTGKGKFARTTHKTSIPISFGDENSPVLADFWGGPADSSDVEALVLSADGKLGVRNSHDDTEAETPIGADRIQRYEAWRDRINTVRNVNVGVGVPGGPGVPGVPGVPGGRKGKTGD